MDEDHIARVVATLLALISELHDDEPCRYDHDDACQSHGSAPRPCPHERARELLAESPGLKDS